jgi:hypothetical protein
MIAYEGEFRFDFSGAISVQKLDDKNRKLPQGMQLVDFVIEENDRILFVEIKDPSCKPKIDTPEAHAALQKQRSGFIKKIANDELIADELTPKARDSYCYLHLMAKEEKKIIYAFLLGAQELTLDPALLMSFKERLLRQTMQECDLPWVRQYVADCVVVTEKNWTATFGYPLQRMP